MIKNLLLLAAWALTAQTALAQETTVLIAPEPAVVTPIPLPQPLADDVTTVTGRVKSVYSRSVRQNGIDWIRRVAEIAVTETDPSNAGAAFRDGDLVYARFWSRADGRPSVQAVRRAPRPGQIVRVDLRRAADGGLDVAAADRLIILQPRLAAKPVAPIVVIPGRPIADNSNFVRGVVKLYDEPQAGARVDLIVEGGIVQTTTTDAAGRFVFDQAPPGPYALVAEGVVKNKIRTSLVIPITVQSPPAAPTTVAVQLEP